MTPIITFVSQAQSQTTGTTEITGRVLDQDGKPLNFSNVIIQGTTLGDMARDGGKFVIRKVPVGTVQVKASFVGFEDQILVDVRVDEGAPVVLEFRLKKGIAGTVRTVRVTGNNKKIDVKSSGVSHVQTGEEFLTLPVRSVTEAVALNAGVVVQGGELHIRGGRGSETSYRIDGIPVDDPLSGGFVDLGLLSVAQQETITGGMDAEYGNASSAIVLLTTKSGGRNFEGNVRYTTDDYGRSDKTYTNFDQLSMGIGGPTPFRELTYYLSGEASFLDGEFLTTKNYPERHYLGDRIKVKERASSSYKAQVRVDWKLHRGLKMSGELTLSKRRNDPYLHNWTTEGFVSKVRVFPRARPNRFRAGFFIAQGNVTMYDGPWFEAAIRQTHYVDIRVDQDCKYCSVPVSENRFMRAVRVVDFRGQGSDPSLPPLYILIDFMVFDGFQNPASTWVPGLEGAPSDSNKAYFNSAEHTFTVNNSSHQLKWTLTHTLSPKTFYEVKLSRLAFNVQSTVDGKTPEEFETAGRFVYVPGRGPQQQGNIDFYTDPSVPFFVTAYDFPQYSRRNTATYLLRTDLTSQRWRGHKIKTGLLMTYNDLDQAFIVNPGRQRQFGDAFGFSKNAFHNFNPEGSMYVQDQWEHEGMVVNAGLRLDYLSPGSGVGIRINSGEIRRDVKRWQSQVSPRLGLAFPITDRDVFHFHYGRFIQFPGKSEIYATQDVSAGVGIMGNPNLEPETSISYQAGIKHQFSNDIAAEFALFNKDVFGLVSSVDVVDDSVGVLRSRYVNKAFASSRGVELGLEKSFSNSFAFNIQYTYSFADGVASDVNFGVRAQGLTFIPTGELPLNWDQRHSLNTTLTLARAGDWVATIVHQYGSGLPWTPHFRFEKRQNPLLENSRRLASSSRLSFRGQKFFSVHGQKLRMFFDGFNLLNDRIVNQIRGSGLVPGLVDADAAYREYATEHGQFGGAYLQDTDGDGSDEFFPVHDPTVFAQARLFRVGLGLEF